MNSKRRSRINAILRALFLATGFGQSCPAAVAPIPPRDWRMELVAQAPDIRHPSVACVAPDGRVFVAEDPMDISTPRADAKEGRIICLHPDGRRTVFAEKLHAVFGMQYLEGKVYVLHNPRFTVFTDTDGIGTSPEDLVESMNPNPWALDWNDHVPANFKLGMDNFFYMAVGDKGVYGAIGRDGKRVDMRGGGILRLRADGTELEVYCTGVRNILDLALTREDEIFTYDNTDEHDWMGRLTHMVDGGFYGYPHDFIPRRPYTLWMMHDFGGGAACGTLAYTEDALPAEYLDNLFLADFGKRQVLRVGMERAGGTWRVASHEDFFRDMPDDFRPVGLAWGADGKSFFVCDWQHRDTKEKVVVGRLWRATYTGNSQASAKPAWYQPAAMGKPFEASTDDLVRGLNHGSKQVRLTAQRALSRGTRGDESEKLRTVLKTGESSTARSHALWALDGLDKGKAARPEIILSANDPDRELRQQVIRHLGEQRVSEAAPVILKQLRDSDASVRLQASTALGRIGDTDSIPDLLSALNEADLFARYAAFTALNRIGRRNPNAWIAIANGLTNSEPQVREGVEFALRETYELGLVNVLGALAARNNAATTPLKARASALRLVISLAQSPAPWKGEWGAYHPALTPAPPKTNRWAGTESSQAIIASLVSDAEPSLRVLAVEALVDPDGATKTVARLKEQFAAEKDATVRAAIIKRLGEFNDAGFASELAWVLRTEPANSIVFSAAAQAARKIRSPELDRTLVSLLKNLRLSISQRGELIEVIGELKVSEALPALETLLADSDLSLRQVAQRAVARIGGHSGLEALRTLLASSSLELRREAVSALGLTHARAVVPDLMSAWREPGTKDAALAALTTVPDVGALEGYLEGLRSSSSEVRKACRKAVAAIEAEALPLVESRLSTMSAAMITELRLAFQKSKHAKAGPLFSQLEAPSGPGEYAQYAMEHPGDPVRGQRVFFDDARAACIKCHAVAGHGGAVGPDLTLIGAQFPRKDLIEHVLEPSKVVREGYQQWEIETHEGGSYSGLIRSESGETITLIGTEGQTLAISRKSISNRKASKVSLMPEGLQLAMTVEQFADLIAYLESRRADPREAKTKPIAEGFDALFAGRELAGWCELPAATKRVTGETLLKGRPPEHWTLTNGLVEHDGRQGDLWTLREFQDFELRLEWRWPDLPVWAEFPMISTNGYEVTNSAGKAVSERVLDGGDSGVLVRGFYKAQANLFCYPVGSGESWEYRTDMSLPEEVRRGVTPRVAGDRAIGDWNELRLVLRGNRMSVMVNEQEVIGAAELPGLPERGAIGLQHEHGRIQFRNVWLKELR